MTENLAIATMVLLGLALLTALAGIVSDCGGW